MFSPLKFAVVVYKKYTEFAYQYGKKGNLEPEYTLPQAKVPRNCASKNSLFSL